MGKRVPLILVHGFSGSPAKTWTSVGVSHPMQDIVSKIPGVYANFPGDAFNYSQDHNNQNWVSDSHLGPALAKTIFCYAQVSRMNEGPGKVIIIGYSLGGLVTKYAATYKLDGYPVANDIGYIIEIASPSGGIDLAPLGVLRYEAECLFGIQVSCDTVQTINALLPEIHSRVNMLPPIPKSIPVFTIAGNVTTPSLSYFFDPLQQIGDDLLVSTESATKDENVTTSGLGGKYIFACNGGSGTLFIDDAECDHLGISHSPTVEKIVEGQISEYVNSLHPPCPSSSGNCIGIHFGDLDADGITDRVGITYVPNACQGGVTSSCQITIHAVLDSGDVITGTVPWNPPGTPASFSYLGVSDIRGDGKGVIFLYATDGCSECGMLFTYELKQGTLQPLVFPSGGLAIGSGAYGFGFTCQVVNGVHQVLSVDIADYAGGGLPGNYTANESLYQANSSGTMVLISQRTVSYTQQQANAAVGAHCPGLSTF